MKPKKQYLVTFYYTDGGSTVITATSARNAAKKLLRLMDEHGLEGVGKYNSCHRDYEIVEVKETVDAESHVASYPNLLELTEALSTRYHELQQVIEAAPAASEFREFRAFEQGQIAMLRRLCNVLAAGSLTPAFYQECQTLLEETAQFISPKNHQAFQL